MDVLVVDDDEQVRTAVRRLLERAAMCVHVAADAQEARGLGDLDPDVVLLDVELPGASGYDLLDELRARDPDLPVIMLTGRGAESERIAGLLRGADDYVVKPFSGGELAARVVAASRRRRRPGAVLTIGDLAIDHRARVVTVAGEAVTLTRREYDLLRHLAVHQGCTFSRDELLQAVWASSTAWQDPATITEHVRRIRSKIEADPARPERLVTVRGAGYRLDPASSPSASEIVDTQ